MNFTFQVHLDDNDYLEFNKFHNFRSPYGKKIMQTLRIIIGAIFFIAIAWYLFASEDRFSGILTAVVLAVMLVLFQAFFKPIFLSSIKRTIARQKKNEKPGYSPISELEFNENFLVEATDDQCTKRKYSTVERVCIVDGSYIYLYISTVAALILPIRSFKSEAQYNEFLEFIKTVCMITEFYNNGK